MGLKKALSSGYPRYCRCCIYIEISTDSQHEQGIEGTLYSFKDVVELGGGGGGGLLPAYWKS